MVIWGGRAVELSLMRISALVLAALTLAMTLSRPLSPAMTPAPVHLHLLPSPVIHHRIPFGEHSSPFFYLKGGVTDGARFSAGGERQDSC